MRLYIAGPMTGLPEFNYPAFHAAGLDLARAGYAVTDPARRGIVDGWEWADYMRAGIRDVTEADGVALLPGWRRSRGATLERAVANELGLDVRRLEEWLRP